MYIYLGRLFLWELFALVAVMQKDERKLNASFPPSLSNTVPRAKWRPKIQITAGGRGPGQRQTMFWEQNAGAQLWAIGSKPSPPPPPLQPLGPHLVEGTRVPRKLDKWVPGDRAGLVVSRGSLLSLPWRVLVFCSFSSQKWLMWGMCTL